MYRHGGILLALILLNVAAFCGEIIPPPVSSPVELETRLQGIVKKLSDDAYHVREQASEDLENFGPDALPLLARYQDDPDVEVAFRVRRAMLHLQGTGGAVEGLTLSAAQAGRKPRPGEAVTLKITLTNVSKHDIHVIQSYLQLTLQPGDRPGSPVDWALDGSRVTSKDFLCLNPGQELSYLMDAEPIDVPSGATSAKAHLIVPPETGGGALSAVYSGREELVSGPVRLSFADDRVDSAAEKLAALIGKNPAAANAHRDDVELADAVRLGLRHASPRERWTTFTFACTAARPEFEDDIVEFLARCGFQPLDDFAVCKSLRTFAQTLSAEKRGPFLVCCLLGQLQDRTITSGLLAAFSNIPGDRDRLLAVRALLEKCRKGERNPDVLNFLAWELFTTADKAIRDPQKAREMAELAVKEAPGDEKFSLTLACVKGDQAGLARISEKVSEPYSQNSLAWSLATRFPAGTVTGEFALKLAEKCVAGTGDQTSDRSYFVDTLAVCHAVMGNYAKALEQERRAYECRDHADGEGQHLAARIACYTALVKGEKDERPRMALDAPPLHSAGARDALLEALKTEKDELVRAEMVKLLKQCYSNDPLVKERLR